ncbi:MAG: transposase [Rhodospirillales bacterium]|nr:transposase [Rhodospirillales bacterium]
MPTRAASPSAPPSPAGWRAPTFGSRWTADGCNVFIERLWRSLKDEDVYLKGYADGREARVGITSWIGFYNGRRPHQALAARTPMAVWRDGIHGTVAGNAVDMTLRLVDAAASTTCPPRQQQQTPCVA